MRAHRSTGVLLVIALVAGCRPDADLDLHGELAAALAAARPYALRLTEARWQSCPEFPDTTSVPGGGARSRCDVTIDAGTQRALTAIAARARRQHRDVGSLDALRTLALIDLVASDDADVLDRVVVQLHEVVASSAGGVENGSLLNEIAVAHVARSAAHGDPLDAFRALDWLERALDVEPSSALLRFNHAWLLEALDLAGEAAAAWRVAHDTDADPAWRDEVSQRAAAANGAAVAVRANLDLLTRADTMVHAALLDTIVAGFPQVAREAVMDELLPRWAGHLRADEVRAADRVLNHACAIAERVFRRTGDRSLLDAALGARNSTVAVVRVRLADAWLAWGLGRTHFRAGSYQEAAPQLRLAGEVIDEGPLRHWPRLYLGLVALYANDVMRAESGFHAILGAADSMTSPALWSHTRWALGLAQARRGAFAASVTDYEIAAALASKLGETGHEARSVFGLGEALGAIGLDRPASLAWARAARLYRADRGATSLHSMMLVLGRRLAETGLPRAALAVHREGLRVAGETGRSKDPIEARIWLARTAAEAGDRPTAVNRLREARLRLDDVDDPFMRDRLDIELTAAEAAAQLAADPAAGLEAITRVIDYYRANDLAVGLRTALPQRAAAKLARGDTPGARADHASVVALIERDLDSLRDPAHRAVLLDSATAAFDGLIAIEAARGATLDALAWLERSRTRFPGRNVEVREATAGDTAFWRSRTSAMIAAVPPGTAVIDYATLSDRLLIFTITRDSARMDAVAIDREALGELVQRFTNQLRIDADSAIVLERAAALHALLIAPVAGRLAGATEVVLIPDGPLHALPFAALRAAGGRHLLRDHVLRYAPSAVLAVGGERGASATSRSQRALLVRNPLFDAAAFPDLAPLRGAMQEIDSIARFHARPTVVPRERATRQALLEGIRTHDLLHFAGHARFHPGRPGQSYLVLTPADHTDRGLLYGSDIAGLDLSGLRLAILSACATHASARTRNGGLGSLALGFLAAGAGGVIGSLWEVPDDATAELMIELHRSLQRGLGPATALREAQLVLLDATDPRLRSPAAWAAFRYEGR